MACRRQPWKSVEKVFRYPVRNQRWGRTSKERRQSEGRTRFN